MIIKMDAISKDNINAVLLAGESDTVEFKLSAKRAKNTLPKIISAFANTKGGIIIIGCDDSKQIVGSSIDEFEIVKSVIFTYKLEDVCNAYTVSYEEKMIIVIQVNKSKSLVFAGGGAYIRKEDTSNIALTSEEVVSRIKSMVDNSDSISSADVLVRLEKKIEQIYDEMRNAQKAHDEEIEAQREEHEKEMKIQNRNNWFFCILSAIIGYLLGKFF